jgi:hypothetical protein
MMAATGRAAATHPSSVMNCGASLDHLVGGKAPFAVLMVIATCTLSAPA